MADSGLGELGFSRRAPSLGSWPLHYPLHSPVRQLQRPCDLAFTLPEIAKAPDLCAVYNDPRLPSAVPSDLARAKPAAILSLIRRLSNDATKAKMATTNSPNSPVVSRNDSE